MLLLFFSLVFSSCNRRLGYGVLLWSSEDPPIPSGTVLPVFIRSNINQVWVAGIPRELRNPETRMDKFEVPLSQLELTVGRFGGRFGSRRRAEARAEYFAPFALMYAETLQDGLPIRERPDNTSRRVYRLRLGEIIKILGPANGVVAVGASGEPLPGRWYRVLTEDGTIGFCFSYRLNIFEHHGGPLAAVRNEQQHLTEDPELDRVLDRRWWPESYAAMINTRRIDLDELSRRWRFDPGHETGVAHIFTRDLDRTFAYSRIRPNGTQSWVFEGTGLQMSLRSDNTLAVQFNEGGLLRTLIFVALHSDLDDIILQETARRDRLILGLYEHGPEFTSGNFGTLTFQDNGRFTWTGNSLLVPQVIPHTALGSGSVEMRLFLSPAMSERNTGAFTMHFDDTGGRRSSVDFMYTLDSQGLRLEFVPQTSLDGITVARRASSPQVIFFFRTERPEPQVDFGFRDPFGTEAEIFPFDFDFDFRFEPED